MPRPPDLGVDDGRDVCVDRFLRQLLGNGRDGGDDVIDDVRAGGTLGLLLCHLLPDLGEGRGQRVVDTALGLLYCLRRVVASLRAPASFARRLDRGARGPPRPASG